MQSLFGEISIIVLSAAILAWAASLTKQPVILGYVLCGVLVGPWGFGMIDDVNLLDAVSHIGITLLLFLAGMVLHPQRLKQLFRSAVMITVAGCLISFLVMYVFMRAFKFDHINSVMAGLALMFSSTILVVKLLPTTTLHQRHMGAVCIAILIVQDLIAVAILVALSKTGDGSLVLFGFLLPVKAFLLIGFAVAFEHFVLRKMMRQADRYHEVLYMLCMGWCLGMSLLSARLGLSYEVGAFIGGVALARSPLSRFLTEQLQPIRDFFLMFFFFVLGARLNLLTAWNLLLPALLATLLIVMIKVTGYRYVFRKMGESAAFSRETGARLAQSSEFGLIIAIAAKSSGHVNHNMAQLIQVIVILTMIVSSYLVIFRYPTPLGTQAHLKQD